MRRRNDSAFENFTLMVRAWNAIREGRSLTNLHVGKTRWVNGKKCAPAIPEIV